MKTKDDKKKNSSGIISEKKEYSLDISAEDEVFDPSEYDDLRSHDSYDQQEDSFDNIADSKDNIDNGKNAVNGENISTKKHKRRLGRKIGRRFKRSAKSLIRLFIIVVITVVISVIYINRDDLSLSNITGWISESLLQGGATEFPVNISGSGVEQMNFMKNSIAAVSDTSLMIIKENGKFAVNRQHNLSNPSMICSKKTVMTYEIGSNIIHIDNRNANRFELEIENKLLAADMNMDGFYAYATRSSGGFMSEFYVYNNDNQNIFRSRQSKYLITDMSISDDNKTIAVLMVGVEGGDFVSVIKLFDLKSETPIETTLDGVLLLALNNTESGILALSQNSIYKFDHSVEQLDRHDFDEPLSEYNFTDNDETLLLHERAQIGDDNRVVVLDENCQIINEVEIKEDITALDRYDDNIYILTPDTLYCYDKNGEYKNEWIMQGNAKSLAVNDGYAYVCDSNMIYSINVK